MPLIMDKQAIDQKKYQKYNGCSPDNYLGIQVIEIIKVMVFADVRNTESGFLLSFSFPCSLRCYRTSFITMN